MGAFDKYGTHDVAGCGCGSDEDLNAATIRENEPEWYATEEQGPSVFGFATGGFVKDAGEELNKRGVSVRPKTEEEQSAEQEQQAKDNLSFLGKVGKFLALGPAVFLPDPKEQAEAFQKANQFLENPSEKVGEAAIKNTSTTTKLVVGGVAAVAILGAVGYAASGLGKVIRG